MTRKEDDALGLDVSRWSRALAALEPPEDLAKRLASQVMRQSVTARRDLVLTVAALVALTFICVSASQVEMRLACTPLLWAFATEAAQ